LAINKNTKKMAVKAIKFWAPWCGPCRVLSKELEGVDLTNINIDEDTEGLSVKYKIRNIPTIIFVNDKEEEVLRKTGLITKAEYQLTIDSLNITEDGGE
jgi:thioredoxin 1